MQTCLGRAWRASMCQDLMTTQRGRSRAREPVGPRRARPSGTVRVRASRVSRRHAFIWCLFGCRAYAELNVPCESMRQPM